MPRWTGWVTRLRPAPPPRSSSSMSVALRQLGNRLVGILHGCLKTGSTYDETTAWAHHQQDLQAVA
jgi:hypothetical protein